MKNTTIYTPNAIYTPTQIYTSEKIYIPNQSQSALESVFEEIHLLGLNSVEKIKIFSATHKTNLWERLEVALYDFICTGTTTSRGLMMALDEQFGQSNVSKESHFGDYNHHLYLKFMGRIASDAKSAYAGMLWLDVLFTNPYSAWIPFIRRAVNNELTGMLRKHPLESLDRLLPAEEDFYTLGATLSCGLSPEDEIFTSSDEAKAEYSLKLVIKELVNQLYPDRVDDICSYAYHIASIRPQKLSEDISHLSPEALYQKSLDLLEAFGSYSSLHAYRSLPAIGLHTISNRFYHCNDIQLEKEIKNSKRRAKTKAHNIARSLSLSL